MSYRVTECAEDSAAGGGDQGDERVEFPSGQQFPDGQATAPGPLSSQVDPWVVPTLVVTTPPPAPTAMLVVGYCLTRTDGIVTVAGSLLTNQSFPAICRTLTKAIHQEEFAGQAGHSG